MYIHFETVNLKYQMNVNTITQYDTEPNAGFTSMAFVKFQLVN